MYDEYTNQKFEKYLEENYTPTSTPDMYAWDGGHLEEDVCHIDDILMNWHEDKEGW
tara:strand:- start:77 stop:244 length:168 start_codon:yes stop_codon:yes gene_type:complete